MTLPTELTEQLDGPAKDLAAALDARIDALEEGTGTELAARLEAIEDSVAAISVMATRETMAYANYAAKLAERIGQAQSAEERAAFYLHLLNAVDTFTGS